MIKGVTRELFYGTGESPGLAQLLSVYGDARININTAPNAVLRALAAEMTDDDVKQIDKYRREAQNNLTDANWYHNIGRATPLPSLATLIKVKSDIFRITAVGVQERMSERITGVVKRAGQKAQLLSWKVE